MEPLAPPTRHSTGAFTGLFPEPLLEGGGGVMVIIQVRKPMLREVMSEIHHQHAAPNPNYVSPSILLLEVRFNLWFRECNCDFALKHGNNCTKPET